MESVTLMAQSRSVKSKSGTGGVYAKVTAAISAASVGIDVYVDKAGTSFDQMLADNTGTHFVAQCET